jgi:hypothetical protein
MMPFSLFPFVLAVCFLVIWTFIAWLEWKESLDASRHDCEARCRAVY